jgi:glutathione S-transferase
MRLIGRYASPFVRRVAVTMQVQGLPYTHVPMMPFGPEKSELTRFNPVARVPVLELDDGECLIDSMAILDHLESLVAPERALVPREGPERRHVLSRLAVMQGVSDKLVAVLYECHFRPRELWHRPWIDACETQIRDGFAWLEDAFEGDWLTGERMTQADLTLAVFWEFGKLRRPGFFGRLEYPKIEALSERLRATPAFQATTPEEMKLSDDLSSKEG